MGFSTGSVVVPAWGDTMDTCCRVRAFRRADFPTFRRPKRPMWRRMVRDTEGIREPNPAPGGTALGTPGEPAEEGDEGDSGSIAEEPDEGWRRPPSQPEGAGLAGCL